RLAAALERVGKHPALVREVAEVRAVREVDASKAIREVAKTFQGLHDFMRVAGVVKEGSHVPPARRRRDATRRPQRRLLALR
ncbi:hypothetical protein MTO96_045180, partial [Rhipicephalus appendiculatus]